MLERVLPLCGDNVKTDIHFWSTALPSLRGNMWKVWDNVEAEQHLIRTVEATGEKTIVRAHCAALEENYRPL